MTYVSGYGGSNFNTHRVRNKRTGHIQEVSPWHASDLVATGEYQRVQVMMKHRQSNISRVEPMAGAFIEEVPCIPCDHWGIMNFWYAAKRREEERAAKGYRIGQPRDWLAYRP